MTDTSDSLADRKNMIGSSMKMRVKEGIMFVMSLNNRGNREEAVYLDQMYRLRAKVFSERLGWEVMVNSGRELDWFDELEPTYILCVLEDGTVAGSARVLPALGPTMLEKTFPQLIGVAGYAPHAGMVEVSRFCVDTSLQVNYSRKKVHEVTSFLFAGIVEWCMLKGYNTIVAVTDIRFERILSLSQWQLQRIGPPLKIGVTTAIAGILPASLDIFNMLKPMQYRSYFESAHQTAA